MVAAKFIVMEGSHFTGRNVNVVDPILPTAGALILLDAAHPITPWAAGVPASGSALTNLAEAQCLAAFPSLIAANVRPTFTIGSTFAANGLAERTTKGGLHLARNTAAGDTNTVAYIQAPGTFWGASGIGGALSDSYFISFWGRTTKAYLSGFTPGLPPHSRFGSSNQMFGFYTHRTTGSVLFPNDSRRIGYREYGDQSTATTLGPLQQNVAISSLTTISGGAYLLYKGNVSAGNEGSIAFYRFYMEDLTKSGRTYAQVDAIDQALFTQDVLTVGGRYYGDTYTNPTTL